MAKNHLFPVVGYALLSIGFTYPVAFRLSTHIPGFGDAPWFLWQLWWFKHAIVDLRQSPLVTDMIYYPLTDVPVTWQTPINEFFTIPLQMISGVVILYNLLFLSSFVLSGYFMYLLVARIVRRRDLAFVGGLVFAFCAYRGVRGLGHLSLLTTQWMPLSLLLLIDCWRRPTIGRGIAAGIGLGLVALSSPYYVAYFLLPLALIGSFYTLVWRRSQLRRPRLWSAAMVAFLGAGAFAFPFYLGFLQADPELQEVANSIANSVYTYSADLLSWVLPPGRNPLWESVTAPIYRQFTTANLVETTLFFGFLPLILAVSSAFLRWHGRRQVFFWQILALTTWILAFGPIMHVGGQPVIPWMPYRLLMELPGFYAFRIPSRLGITSVISMTILAIMVLERFVERRPSWPWRAVLTVWCTLLLISVAFDFPYPTSSIAIPSVHRLTAETPGEFAILELPAGRVFPEQTKWYMYYQSYHGKRLVSGVLGRRPPRLHVPEESLPFVQRFFTNDRDRLVDLPGSNWLSAENWPKDVRYARALLDAQGIRYVVLHCPSPSGPFCRPAAFLLNLGVGFPTYRDGTSMLYSVPPGSSQTPMEGDHVALTYDRAFSEPFVHDNGYARVLQESGNVSLSLPVSGTWDIYAELEGRLADGVRVFMNGEPVLVQTFAYSESLKAFRLEGHLPAGTHSLLVEVPVDTVSTAQDTKPCDPLCLRNLTVMLRESDAEIVDATQVFGDLISLTSYSVQQYLNPGSDNPKYAVQTNWACQDRLPADYTLYVHYVDESGNTLAQDDHMLGRYLGEGVLPTSQWVCPGHYSDISYIPQELVEEGDLEAAVGLWIPETGEYLQPSGELRVDEFGRTRLEFQLE